MTHAASGAQAQKIAESWASAEALSRSSVKKSSLSTLIQLLTQSPLPLYKYLEMFPPRLPTFTSFLMSLEKSTSQSCELQKLKIHTVIPPSHVFLFLCPLPPVTWLLFRPGLILSGPRPMLICMAILCTHLSLEDSRPAWIQTPICIHQVSPAQGAHCTGKGRNEYSTRWNRDAPELPHGRADDWATPSSLCSTCQTLVGFHLGLWTCNYGSHCFQSHS